MLKRLEIEGPVILKRKKAWVRRVAKVQDCFFSYKNKQSDQKDKMKFDLRSAKIMLSPAGDDRKQSMIYIQPDPLKSEAIRVVFDSETIFNQWLQIIRDNSKSDEEINMHVQKYLNSQNESLKKEKKSVQLTQNQELINSAQQQIMIEDQQMNFEKEIIQKSKMHNYRKTEIASTEESQYRNQNTKKLSSSLHNGINKQLVNRITQQTQIQNMIKDIIQKMFKLGEQDWHLNDSTDGINVYTSCFLQSIMVKNQETRNQFDNQCQLTQGHSNQGLQYSYSQIILETLVSFTTILLISMNSQQITNSLLPQEVFEFLRKMSFNYDINFSHHIFLCLLILQITLSFASFTNKIVSKEKLKVCGNQNVFPEIQIAEFDLKLQFFVLSTPDEVLKMLSDLKLRCQWDFGLIAANNQSQQFSFSYQGLQNKEYLEIVEYNYFVDQQKFYIFENIKQNSLKQIVDLEYRVWILEQVLNRPFFMRVTFLAKVNNSYQKNRGAQNLLKSVCALRNMLQYSDKVTEMPINIKQDNLISDASNNQNIRNTFSHSQGVIKASLYQGNFINDAIELIEDEQNTIEIQEDVGLSTDEEIYSRTVSKSIENKQTIFKSKEQDLQQFKENYEVPKIMWDMENINDWGYRIQNYSQEQKQFYNQMVPKFNELKGIMASTSEWNTLHEKKDDYLLIDTKKSVRGLTICRGQGPVEWPAIDIWRCMCYAPFKQEWDVNNDKSQYLKKIGANAYIYYSKTKSKTGFSSRDFVLQMIMNIEKDGTIIVCCSSSNCTYDFPQCTDATRADSPISGTILIPDKSNPNKTYMYVINELDLKTSLPGYLIRSAYKDQGMQIERLRSVIPKWKKLFPNDYHE